MTESVSRPTTHSQWFVYVVLALLLFTGLALRVWNVNFDQGIGSHPDERSTACFYATTIRLPDTWQEFRDPHQSPLNPLWDTASQTRRSFTYGHFPLYLGVAASEAMHRLSPLAERVGSPDPAVQIMARAHQDCDAIAVAGRLTIALLDTLTIVLVFLLGRALFGSLAGLLAAAFYTFSAQAIQLSHFFAMDPASTTFIVLTVYGGVKMLRENTLSSALLTGVAAGLAVSSKFSSLPILAVPVAAGILAMVCEGQRARRDARPADGRLQFRATLGILVALIVAGIAFAVTSPYAVLDWRSFVQATLVEQGRMVRGIADMPFTRQYRNTTPYVYFIWQQVVWGLWWPLGLVALTGTLVMLANMLHTLFLLLRNWLTTGGRQSATIRLPASHQLGLLIVWAWVIPYFAITGAFLAKFNRYMSPLLPFAALFAAGAIWLLWHRGVRQAASAEQGADGEEVVRPESRRLSWQKVLAATVAAIALAGAIFWSAAFVNGVYRGEHTWITASRWIYENVPDDSVILWELWDDPLPKTIPGEQGMDMGTHRLRNIDWSPYEEDTQQKYEILKSKLREADYVAYSSKRIYDSVDELPQRYPMTTRYYDAMWDGSLGFEVAFEATSPPRLFGIVFDDREADESWSLYDHPQVTIFRKVRDLSDEDFDRVLGGTWATAVPYFTGEPSLVDRPLMWLGLRAEPGSEYRGLLGTVLRLLDGEEVKTPEADTLPSLMLDQPLAELDVVDDYRWNTWASERPIAAAVTWWFVLTLLAWAIWPLCFHLFGSFRDRGYLLSRTAGWLVAGWVLWFLASLDVLQNTVRNAWLCAAAVALAGAIVAARSWRSMGVYLRNQWPLLLASEALALTAFAGFVLVRMANPDLWQPWFGGEKFMEFAFLNGILRSPTFPPVDPHFAGGFINYYYFGIYLAAYLIKLTGIYAEVAFNLTIAMLFALTVSNAFSIAHTAYAYAAEGFRTSAAGGRSLSWRSGFAAALITPLFIALLGNLDGYAQVASRLSEEGRLYAQNASVRAMMLPDSIIGLWAALTGKGSLPAYDFWAPSRVIPNTINEFPFWSFLFADLHPHLIGVPIALLFCALLLALLGLRQGRRLQLILILVALAFLLGALSSVNLWELPTYLALGLLGLAVQQFKHTGRVRLGVLAVASVLYVAVPLILFGPFLRNYVNIGASGIGLVRGPDSLSTWLLIWGLFVFVAASWIAYAIARRPGQCRQTDDGCKPAGSERAYSLVIRQYDRLPRAVYLHRMLVKKPTFGYLLGLAVVPVAIGAGIMLLFADRAVLSLCLILLGPAWMLLWKRGTDSDPAALLIALLSVASLAILAGTQVVYLRDFLAGGDWYRMNTLFKFFMQVWVLIGLAAAIAVPRLWRGLSIRQTGEVGGQAKSAQSNDTWLRRTLTTAWMIVLVLLIGASLAFPIFGTPARISQRLTGWRPEFGTLNGMDYMRQGVYSWPDATNAIDLQHDWEAIRWLLDNVRGNPVIVESSEVDYYRAGSTRVASFTGISGLRGMHESEQRPGEVLSEREQLHREFWTNPDIGRTMEIIDQLNVSLVYAGQLERFLHPDGVAKLEMMAEQGLLSPIFQNEGTTVYEVAGRLVERVDGILVPVPLRSENSG